MNRLLNKLLSVFSSSQDQGRLFDSTVYCRIGGLDPEKIAKHNFAGMLIQTGRGLEIVKTLQDQIDVAEMLDLPWAGWHIPDPLDGPMDIQAELVVSQPRVKGHLLIGDFEPRYSGNPASLASPDEALQFLQTLDELNGRKSWGYANPNVLLNIYRMPAWVYTYDWWIAQYPSSSWKYFDQFLKYYAWKYPSYFQNDEAFQRRIKMWQWTQWGDAQTYYASTTLPDGGSGIKSGDLDIAMMTKEEIQAVLAVDEPPQPPQPPSDLEERVKELENTQTAILATITDLVEFDDEVHDKLVEFEQRIELLEEEVYSIKLPPVEELPYIEAKVNNSSNCSVYRITTHDRACEDMEPPGKPIFEDKIAVLQAGTPVNIFASFKYSCKDNPNDPWVIQSGGDEFAVIYNGPYAGLFIPRKKLQ